MPMRPGNAIALLIALGATIASVVVWNDGSVNLGMELAEVDGEVRVADVTPDGNAAWNYWQPGLRVMDLTTVDGRGLERGEPLPIDPEAFFGPAGGAALNPYGPLSGEDGLVEPAGPSVRPPAEAVPSALIETAVGGHVAPDQRMAYVFATLDRTLLELELRSSLWILAFGAALGVLVWRLLHHGVAGVVGRQHSLLVGIAAAAPFLILPVVEAGTAAGIAAGFLVPAALALILGLALARQHPDRSWSQTGAAGAAVAAGLATVLLIRHMTSPTLETDDREQIGFVIAAIAVVPAAIAATRDGPTVRQRLGVLSLSLVPGAAGTLMGARPDPFLPTALIGLLVGWQLLPAKLALPAIGERLTSVRTDGPAAGSASVAGITARARDVMALGFLGALLAVAILGSYDAWPVIAAVGLAGLAGLAVRRGFLGPSWTDAAVPLAVAIGTPVALSAFPWTSYGSAPLALMALASAGLPVAHVLASRYPDGGSASGLLIGSAGAILGVWLLAALDILLLAVPLLAAVALLPGAPLAVGSAADGARTVSNRLETAAVALTPLVAAAASVSIGIVILIAWLIALVVWKYLTVAPLMRLAQRTELQRDVAVAAAETERARLAADLHDDALQQLTMLVRRLDERGDADTADEAREIAAKLRAVVGDLRLPILDDLGAGPALEWLVERVEPLAGGPVTLERSDAVRPPPSVELAVFRVAQEALTNAIKHGRPPIAVRYDVRADGRVTLAVDDAGEGIGSDAADEAPHHGHFGLLNMQQRAEQIGALLDVRRWPDGGTRVALEWRPQ